MNKLIFLALLILTSGCDGCKDPDDCPDRFHVPAEIIPYQEVYHIGDTITFISKFDRYVHELQTDQKYDMKNNVELIGQINKNVEVSSIDENLLIDLKIQLDDEYGDGDEKLEIETE